MQIFQQQQKVGMITLNFIEIYWKQTEYIFFIVHNKNWNIKLFGKEFSGN